MLHCDGGYHHGLWNADKKAARVWQSAGLKRRFDRLLFRS